MARYAQNTSVSVHASVEEIRRQLNRFGADGFGFLESKTSFQVLFKVQGLHVRMELALPSIEEFRTTPSGRRRRDDNAADNEREKEVRRRMRSLAAVVKAKLIAVEDGVSTMEAEFMPFIVLADDTTIGDRLLPAVREAALAGRPLALPSGVGE